MNYWISKGFPNEKIVLGLAFYGRGFKLADPMVNKPGSPARGPSAAGNFTKEAGVIAYFEVNNCPTKSLISKLCEKHKKKLLYIRLDLFVDQQK